MHEAEMRLKNLAKEMLRDGKQARKLFEVGAEVSRLSRKSILKYAKHQTRPIHYKSFASVRH
jgi:hypothetical protein